MATGFWTQSSLEPKRKYRFLVRLGNYQSSATWYAKMATKPSFRTTTTEHAYLNHKFYYPGRIEWQEVTVTLIDPVDPDAMSETLRIVQECGYNIPTDQNQTSTTTKGKSVTALGAVEIVQIDSNGGELEVWKLNNAFITNIDMGDLSYSEDALSEIKLPFRYDWATCTVDGPNFISTSA